jgi:hypothetical protein
MVFDTEIASYVGLPTNIEYNVCSGVRKASFTFW